jgi:nifR3 family TIM-barrel protein
MAGVTDRDFRLIVRRIGGVGVVAMEFLSSKGLVGGDPRVERLTWFAEEERPIAIQIYGSDAATMAEAARIVEAMGADLCDINMGCPANKVLKGCAGAALMGDLARAAEIVRAVRRAIAIPLTVKFRLGLDDRRKNFLELGRICAGEGAQAVAMHSRTARQMFSGRADWAELARLKAALPIPVIGNGDVASADDAVRMLAETGCDGVMIGRAATRNPWIFREIAARLGRGRAPSPTLADRRALILDHFRTVVGREDETAALHKLRKFTSWYSHGLPEGVRLRRRLNDLGSAREVLGAVEEFLAELPLAA